MTGTLESNLTQQMLCPDRATAEQLRLRELSWLRILDTPREERFDRYTRLVADVFDAASVTISLIDEHRQWKKSAFGIGDSDISRDVAFCSHAISTDFMEVPDAREDPRFADNPFVVGEPFIRFYAGAVLRGPTGQPLGALCLIDYAPRRLSAAERSRLIAFAELVQEEMNTGGRDGVTGLPEAASVEEQLERALGRADAQAQRVSVIHLRVTNFEEVATLDGREIGDWLMHEISERLRQIVRATDVISRMDTDGFLVAIPGLEDRDKDANRIRVILDKLSQPVRIGEHWHHPAMAAGVARYPADGTRAGVMLNHARTALRAVVSAGQGGAFCFYSHDLYEQARRAHDQTMRLAAALAGNRLQQVYQPFIDLPSGEVVAFEALARWHDPDYGDISPGVFIPLSESDPELRRTMTSWSLDTACQQIAALNARQPNRLRASVNIPGAELQHEDFTDLLWATLRRHQIRADQIILELTEQSLIANLKAVAATMNTLRAEGIQFAVDDFGTGYSSLGYLQQLPLDILKIDRCFIQDVADEAVARDLTRGIIHISRALRLRVVAEGIETPAQLAALNALNCNEGQGFHLGRPESAEKLLEQLRERNGWA